MFDIHIGPTTKSTMQPTLNKITQYFIVSDLGQAGSHFSRPTFHCSSFSISPWHYSIFRISGYSMQSTVSIGGNGYELKPFLSCELR